jgi:hypothetical protein
MGPQIGKWKTENGKWKNDPPAIPNPPAPRPRGRSEAKTAKCEMQARRGRESPSKFQKKKGRDDFPNIGDLIFSL